MNFKKVMKILSIVLAIAAAAGVVYVFVQRFLNNRSIEADNKLQYASFGSENDEFISEERLA